MSRQEIKRWEETGKENTVLILYEGVEIPKEEKHENWGFLRYWIGWYNRPLRRYYHQYLKNSSRTTASNHLAMMLLKRMNV